MNKINTNTLIVTNNPNAFVGAIVMWHLSGDVRLTALKDAWIEQGLSPKLLPPLPSSEVCLTRAVDDITKGALSKKHIKGGGYRLDHDANHGKEKADVHTVATATLDEKDNPKIVMDDDYEAHWRNNAYTQEALEKGLTENFTKHQGQLSHRDISPWLCGKMMRHFGATTLKSNGGCYFVPRERVEELTKMVHALNKASGHRIYRVKAMTDNEAVEMVLDAISREADKEAKEVEEDLARGHGENEGEESDVKPLGPRACESRANRCRVMIEKVRTYEKLLDRRLDDIRERLGDLKVAAMEASLAANEKDAA